MIFQTEGISKFFENIDCLTNNVMSFAKNRRNLKKIRVIINIGDGLSILTMEIFPDLNFSDSNFIRANVTSRRQTL